MKKIDKLINEVNKMLEEANKIANVSACGYDEGFYVGRGDALEDVLKLLEEHK
jgi:hypothetical protein